MTLAILKNDKGREFTVRLIRKGDGYGRGRVVRWESEEPGFEIYDRTYAGQAGFEPEGQIVSQYYVCTIAEVQRGIDLHGGVPEWKIDAAAFAPVVRWAQDECAKVPEVYRIGSSRNEARRTHLTKQPEEGQIIHINVQGNRTPVRVIIRPDGVYAAGTQKKRGRRWIDVIGSGNTREAALQDMLAKYAAT